jgi:hypothetical protein
MKHTVTKEISHNNGDIVSVHRIEHENGKSVYTFQFANLGDFGSWFNKISHSSEHLSVQTFIIFGVWLSFMRCKK